MNDKASLDNEELVRRITRDLADSYDEELELEIEDRHPLPGLPAGANGDAEKAYRQRYFGELFRLQAELVKLQDWVIDARQKSACVDVVELSPPRPAGRIVNASNFPRRRQFPGAAGPCRAGRRSSGPRVPIPARGRVSKWHSRSES